MRRLRTSYAADLRFSRGDIDLGRPRGVAMRVLALANLDGQAPPRAALQTVARAAGVAAIVFVGDVLPPRDGLIADDADRYDAFFGALGPRLACRHHPR